MTSKVDIASSFLRSNVTGYAPIVSFSRTLSLLIENGVSVPKEIARSSRETLTIITDHLERIRGNEERNLQPLDFHSTYRRWGMGNCTDISSLVAATIDEAHEPDLSPHGFLFILPKGSTNALKELREYLQESVSIDEDNLFKSRREIKERSEDHFYERILANVDKVLGAKYGTDFATAADADGLEPSRELLWNLAGKFENLGELPNPEILELATGLIHMSNIAFAPDSLDQLEESDGIVHFL